jgi:hypothetical protein
MEAVVLGVNVILAGAVEVPGGLWPPQAGRRRNKNTAKNMKVNRTRPNSPMHPLVARGRMRHASRWISMADPSSLILNYELNGKLE